MAIARSKIEGNLRRIREDVAAACQRVGRRAQDVSIVAVTKTVDLDTIKGMLDAGLTDLGESRVQQLTARAEDLAAYLRRRRNELPRPVRWHMIGHLQRNKVRATLEHADVIHSVDSLRLAEEINAKAEQFGKTVEVYLQVNCSEEPQKCGVAVGAAMHLAELICTLPQLRLIGLMTLAPLDPNPEHARPTFVRLRELFDEMRHDKVGGGAFHHLSMGMSMDYTVAVEESATVLRIGTALFQ